ncbi:MAG: HEAT repeat domain-containing protein [Myxococcota bacterium]
MGGQDLARLAAGRGRPRPRPALRGPCGAGPWQPVWLALQLLQELAEPAGWTPPWRSDLDAFLAAAEALSALRLADREARRRGTRTSGPSAAFPDETAALRRLGERCRPALEAALRDPDAPRWPVLQGITDARSVALARLALRVLADDPDPDLRWAALQAAFLARPAAFRQAFLDALHDPAWEVRRAAASYLAQRAGGSSKSG